MARQSTREIEGLRDIYDYRKEFDVTLACAFEPDVEKGCKERFQFYDSIGEVVRKIGKRPFLPHREVRLDWPPEKIAGIINGIIIPSSDIVIGYLDVNSTVVGIMIGRALGLGVPVSYLYNERVENFLSERGLFGGDVYDLIEFRTDKEGLQKLELSLKAFYNSR